MVSEFKAVDGGYLNRLEPESAIDSFLEHPPVGFTPFSIEHDGVCTPAFLAPFDLLTTLDDGQRWLPELLGSLGLKRLLTFRTLFLGTTVSEYVTLGNGKSYRSLLLNLLSRLRQLKAELLIIKDLPHDSPLVSRQENEQADRLMRACGNADFLLVSGQALAYVPINFCNMEEFFGGLSYKRRKEFRRKLRKSASLKIEELRSGDSAFFDQAFLEELYRLYMNVFSQSKYHFDRLTPQFFKSLLQDHSSGGVVFVYRTPEGKMIGYNICFVHKGNLVDKYIGLLYPEAKDYNLYFTSWFYNLEYALKHGLNNYVAGWTDPEVKASLGAKFTFTRHAVYVCNPILRAVLRKLQHLFEADKNWASKELKGSQA